MFKPHQIIRNLSYRWEYILILRKLWIDKEPNGYLIAKKDNKDIKKPRIDNYFTFPTNKRTFKNDKYCTMRDTMAYFKKYKVPFVIIEDKGTRGELVYQLWKEMYV